MAYILASPPVAVGIAGSPSQLGARHILSTVYAVDKQIQIQADGNFQLDKELEERLQEFVQTVSNTQLDVKQLAYSN